MLFSKNYTYFQFTPKVLKNNVSVYFLAGELTAFESTVDETEAEEFRVAAALLMSAAKETSTQEKPVENGE